MHRADEHFSGSGRVTAARARHIPVIGVGGPVGSGKTALVEALCLRLRDHVSLAVVTNDIFTKEDAEFLTRRGALPPGCVRRLHGSPYGDSRRFRRPECDLEAADRKSVV